MIDEKFFKAITTEYGIDDETTPTYLVSIDDVEQEELCDGESIILNLTQFNPNPLRVIGAKNDIIDELVNFIENNDAAKSDANYKQIKAKIDSLDAYEMSSFAGKTLKITSNLYYDAVDNTYKSSLLSQIDKRPPGETLKFTKENLEKFNIYFNGLDVSNTIIITNNVEMDKEITINFVDENDNIFKFYKTPTVIVTPSENGYYSSFSTEFLHSSEEDDKEAIIGCKISLNNLRPKKNYPEVNITFIGDISDA